MTVYYGPVLALDNVSFGVEKGEIVTLIGPNGAGKSTALNAVCGRIEYKTGEVVFDGEKINGNRPHELVHKGLSLVPEGRRLFHSMTVRENLEMGAYSREGTHGGNTKLSGFLYRIFEMFPVLKERQKQRSATLSSGEQQMLAIGRSLMLNPKILLLDEPSLGLSPNYIEIVFEKIKEINSKGTTILIVEHNAKMALEYSDRGYVFDIGKIAFEDESKNLLKNRKIQELFLGK